jgi:uncharacterized tellurite resistance protein B-like protein
LLFQGFAIVVSSSGDAMSIILALLAALAGVGTLLWRVNAAADATKGLVETANDLSNLRRRWSWRRKSNVDPLLLVDDPRLAAVTLMMAIAQSDGALTAVERATIVRQAMEHFGCSSKVADEMVGYARFLLTETRDPTNCLLKLKPLILKSCSAKERADLLAMLRAVGEADGVAGDLERRTIDQWAHDLA